MFRATFTYIIQHISPHLYHPLNLHLYFIYQGLLVHLYNMICVTIYFLSLRCPILILPHSNSMSALDTEASIPLKVLENSGE